MTDGLSNFVHKNMPSISAGTLCFWGSWFGRPMDNIHRLVGAVAIGDHTVLYFDHAETLLIESPDDWAIEKGSLIVRQAKRVRFQWFLYGEIPGPQNLYYRDYHSVDGQLQFSTNYSISKGVCGDLEKPALRLNA